MSKVYNAERKSYKRRHIKGEVIAYDDPKNIKKFLDYVGTAQGSESCWVWPMCKDPRSGHTTFCLIGGKRVSASRYSLSALVRPPIGAEVALFRCGHTQCVNPDHLYWGTRSDRAKNAVLAGDLPLPETVGRKNSQARLDEDAVAYIRSSDKTGAELADLFGVSFTTISMCQLGRTWAHLPGARDTVRTGVPHEGYINTGRRAVPSKRPSVAARLADSRPQEDRQ